MFGILCCCLLVNFQEIWWDDFVFRAALTFIDWFIVPSVHLNVIMHQPFSETSLLTYQQLSLKFKHCPLRHNVYKWRHHFAKGFNCHQRKYSTEEKETLALPLPLKHTDVCDANSRITWNMLLICLCKICSCSHLSKTCVLYIKGEQGSMLFLQRPSKFTWTPLANTGNQTIFQVQAKERNKANGHTIYRTST